MNDLRSLHIITFSIHSRADLMTSSGVEGKMWETCKKCENVIFLDFENIT